MHSRGAALYIPLQLWGALRQDLMSSLLNNCSIIHSLGIMGSLTRNVSFVYSCLIGVAT